MAKYSVFEKGLLYGLYGGEQKSVRLNMHSKNFLKLAEEFRSAAKDLKAVEKDIAKSVAEKGVEFLKEQTPEALGHLKESSRAIEKPKSYKIMQSLDYAKFVEFGTGDVGRDSPKNPEMPSSWEFNVGPNVRKDGEKPVYNLKGDKVMFYKSTNHWVFPNPYSDGSFMFTRGQPARMQMYKTRLYLRENRLNLAKEFLSNGGK